MKYSRIFNLCAVLVIIVAAVIMVRAFTKAAIRTSGDDTTTNEPDSAIVLPADDDRSVAQPHVTVAPPASDSPARLVIPSLDIDAPVEHVGISRKGTMAVPTAYADVGWYRYGAKPGEIGNAVMAGHVDNGLGLAAVFKDLASIRKGSEISVVLHDGTIVKFIVKNVRTYAYDKVPTETIFGTSTTARLQLITCAGTWNPDDRMYDRRVVVTAERTK